MFAVLVRILLRYAAGALAAKGILSPTFTDLLIYDYDVSMLVDAGLAVALGALSEFWYWFARRCGWTT